MLYGTDILCFNCHETAQINTCQSNLFKKILGIPQSAANEAVFLLTGGLIPLYTQIEQRCLLLLGQLAALPQDSFEKRTLLHATSSAVPLIKTWNKILNKYNLPDTCSLIEHPMQYHKWKSLVKKSIMESTLGAVSEAIITKSSLSLWKDLDPLPPPILLFPMGLAPHLRKAQIARAQLLTNTYLLQTRLLKIRKSQHATCPLCHKEDEDVRHFVALCNTLHAHRCTFIRNIVKRFPGLGIHTNMDRDDPEAFIKLVLLPNPDLIQQDSNILTTIALQYILKIHTLRAALNQQ